ncbi:FTR1 family iron permease [Piscirickettsia litoralis]|nr:FTR1 family protein [Piscirickettsia litoralis]
MIFNGNFYAAFSSSFWIIPREGTEALLVIIMLCSAFMQSGREDKLPVVYKNCIAALIAGLVLAAGCIWFHSLFTGQGRELSEAFASLIAMAMLLYVNFETFKPNNALHQMSVAALGFMAFISVFRELAETILFYYSLFQGDTAQQAGTFAGLIAGVVLLAAIFWLHKTSSTRWKIVNRFIFNITPLLIFILAVMCIGNAVNAFQESRLLGFTPVNWMFNSNLIHAQASEEYGIALIIFLASTGLLFIKQFYSSLSLLLSYLAKKLLSQTQSAASA